MSGLKHIAELLRAGLITEHEAALLNGLPPPRTPIKIHVDLGLFLGYGVDPKALAEKILERLREKVNNSDENNGPTQAGRCNPIPSGPGTSSIPNPNHFTNTWPGCKPEEATGNGCQSETKTVAGWDGNAGVSMASEQDVDLFGFASYPTHCVRCRAPFADAVTDRWQYERTGPLCGVCFKAVEAEAVAEKIQAFNEPEPGCYK